MTNATRPVFKIRNSTQITTSKRCPLCKSIISSESNKCITCICKQKARKYLGNSKRWKLLLTVFEKQRGICPYTGTKLKIGYNCNIDHIVAKASGGRNKIENFQWVYTPVNLMKGSMSEIVFLDLVKLIHNYRSRRQ